MDIFDQAQFLEELHREESLTAQAMKMGSGHSLSHCMDCGEEISPARAKLIRGVKRCVGCQEFFEQEGRK